LPSFYKGLGSILRQTDRQTDTHTHTHTEREREREREREKSSVFLNSMSYTAN
jgi:hypothetical protein